jgi:site-specific recombinase XerC
MKNVAMAPQASPLPTVTPLEERDEALAALARDCGLTAEQIARLDVASVDLERDVVRIARGVGPTRPATELPVPPAALRPVARYLEHARGVLAGAGVGGPDSPEPAALFLSKTGRRMAGSDVRRRLASFYTRIESARVRAAYLRSHPRA